VWRGRLEEIGIRVINALIEMGDIDCARRTLEANIAAEAIVSTETSQRIALLYLKIGDLKKARAVQNVAGDLQPLLAIADGRYTEAAEHWEVQLQENSAGNRSSLLKQNLAVAYLYSGMIAKARDALHGLVDIGESFESLTVNLATLYELSSDRSKDLKLAAAAKIAGYQKDRGIITPLINAAFKL
jgi:tetratricopeptide (TPR) repeat protein